MHITLFFLSSPYNLCVGNVTCFCAESYLKKLYQSAIVDICEGLERYDLNKANPTTYFSYKIHEKMREYVDTFVNKTTTHYSSGMKKIKDARQRLRERGVFEPTLNDIAFESGLGIKTIEECINIEKVTVNQVSCDSEEYVEKDIVNYSKSPEQILIDEETNNLVRTAINKLTEDEKDAILLRFRMDEGGDDEEEEENSRKKTRPFKEVAAAMNTTADAVRALVNSGSRKLSCDEELQRYWASRDKMCVLDETCIEFKTITKEIIDSIDVEDLEF